MPKIEDEIKNIKSQLEDLKKHINQMNFNIIRIMGTLEEKAKTGVSAVLSEEALASVSVDLGPIEERIEKLEQQVVTKPDLNELKELVKELASERVKKAEELQERASNLLEKGMELVELEATLAEIKSLLQERILEEEDQEE